MSPPPAPENCVMYVLHRCFIHSGCLEFSRHCFFLYDQAILMIFSPNPCGRGGSGSWIMNFASVNMVSVASSFLPPFQEVVCTCFPTCFFTYRVNQSSLVNVTEWLSRKYPPELIVNVWSLPRKYTQDNHQDEKQQYSENVIFSNCDRRNMAILAKSTVVNNTTRVQKYTSQNGQILNKQN
jgi:hypothetical protein